MTLDLEAIKARCEAATPGPWTNTPRHCQWKPGDDEMSGLGFDLYGPPEPELRGMLSRWADGDFIAHARDNIPALVAEVERLTAERDAAVDLLRRITDNDGPTGDSWETVDDAARWLALLDGR